MNTPYLYIITGSEGFIGSAFVNYFLKIKDIHVIGVDIKKSSIINPKYGFIRGDISDISTFKKVLDLLEMRKFKNFSIFHLAAQTSAQISMEEPLKDINTNLIGLLNLISTFENSSLKPDLFMLFSSMAVYGNDVRINNHSEFSEKSATDPNSIYGYTKLASEKILELSSFPYVPLRLFNIFGPGQDMNNNKQGMVSIYLADLLKTGSISVKGGLHRTRDFVFIDDLISIVMKIFDYKIHQKCKNSKPINISTGTSHSVEQLVNYLFALYNKKLKKSTKLICLDSTPGDMEFSRGNNSYLKSMIGEFEFTKFEVGIEKMFDWALTLKL